MWIWIVLGAIGTFIIAAGAVGSVTGTLASRPRRSGYDLNEAVDFVAERLPDDVTATLTYDDVEAVLSAHCDYLADKGVASDRTADDIGSGLVVVPDDEPVAYILGRIDQAGLDITDEQVLTVLT